MNIYTSQIATALQISLTRWVVAAPWSSPFGRYRTASAARKDAKVYGLKLKRREDFDSQYF
jgi:hypothetical protein